MINKKVVFADLHTHTTASDGQYTPTQLVHLAAQTGLDVLAITDHDTIAGLEEGIAAGKELGITVVRGIELSAKEYPTFHILGYNFSPSGEKLNQICQEMKQSRDERKYRITNYLIDKGVRISLSEVEELAAGIVGKPHFAQVLVRHGYAASVQDAFNKYLNTPDYRKRVKREKPSAKRCIEAIKAAGGKAVLAHPYQIGIPNIVLDSLIEELKRYGLDGIEVLYPEHNAEMQDIYLHLAYKHGLKWTGGSDFHGEKVKLDIQLAHHCLDLDWLLN